MGVTGQGKGAGKDGWDVDVKVKEAGAIFLRLKLEFA